MTSRNAAESIQPGPGLAWASHSMLNGSQDRGIWRAGVQRELAEAARLLLTRPWKSHSITSATFDCIQVRPVQIQDGKRGELNPNNLWRSAKEFVAVF